MKTLARAQDFADLRNRLRIIRHDSVARWGRMSAHQMICHLSDGYRLLTGDMTSAPAATPLPRAVMKWVALYAPMRWPAGIPTTPELDQYGGGTKPAEFAADLVELERLLTIVATDDRVTVDCQPHPIFGRMSKSAWLRWAYLHADHHLRQFGL